MAAGTKKKTVAPKETPKPDFKSGDRVSGAIAGII